LTQHKLSDPPVLESDEDIDIHIGQRLRGLRVARGLSQTDVAAKVDLSFQQIQKYESGKSRVTAAKLCSLARALDIPVNFFFEEYQQFDEPGMATPNGLSEKAWLLAGQFDRIDNPKTQAKVLALVKALTEE